MYKMHVSLALIIQSKYLFLNILIVINLEFRINLEINILIV